MKETSHVSPSASTKRKSNVTSSMKGDRQYQMLHAPSGPETSPKGWNSGLCAFLDRTGHIVEGATLGSTVSEIQTLAVE
jgi:hypothetical protein